MDEKEADLVSVADSDTFHSTKSIVKAEAARTAFQPPYKAVRAAKLSALPTRSRFVCFLYLQALYFFLFKASSNSVFKIALYVPKLKASFCSTVDRI